MRKLLERSLRDCEKASTNSLKIQVANRILTDIRVRIISEILLRDEEACDEFSLAIIELERASIHLRRTVRKIQALPFNDRKLLEEIL